MKLSYLYILSLVNVGNEEISCLSILDLSAVSSY